VPGEGYVLSKRMLTAKIARRMRAEVGADWCLRCMCVKERERYGVSGVCVCVKERERGMVSQVHKESINVRHTLRHPLYDLCMVNHKPKLNQINLKLKPN
jgi:hypothetical protein